MSDSKPPAFRFYAADFVIGTATMTNAQTGSYVLLLCYQWDNGSVPADPKQLAKIGRCSPKMAAEILASKFPQWEDGQHRNRRLERERDKALSFSKSQSEKGASGAKKRWQNDSRGHPPAMPRPSSGHSRNMASGVGVSTVVLNTERTPSAADFPEADRPDENAVKFYASQIGLAEWKALDWLNEMKGCGWLDYQHRPIADWRAVLTRVKVKWESDGRPKQPPTNPKTHENNRPNPADRNAGTYNAAASTDDIKRKVR